MTGGFPNETPLDRVLIYDPVKDLWSWGHEIPEKRRRGDGVVVAGVEYYFGYKLPQNDLLAEDYRRRDRSWDYCRIAIDFFKDSNLPFVEMENRDDLIGNPDHGRDKYCLAKPGEVYLEYLGYVPTAELDLSSAQGTFSVRWFNPRQGGALQEGSVTVVQGGEKVQLGSPPSEPEQDWVILVRSR